MGVLNHMVILFFFLFLRQFHTVFHSGCINLHTYTLTNNAQGFPVLHFLSNFLSNTCYLFIYLFIYFLIIAIRTGVRWFLTVALICISLMNSDAEYLFIYLLAIYVSSLWRCLLNTFAHLLEKEIVTQSISLTWKIPCTEEPGRLQSMELQGVGHDWATENEYYLLAGLFVW